MLGMVHTVRACAEIYASATELTNLRECACIDNQSSECQEIRRTVCTRPSLPAPRGRAGNEARSALACDVRFNIELCVFTVLDDNAG